MFILYSKNRHLIVYKDEDEKGKDKYASNKRYTQGI